MRYKISVVICFLVLVGLGISFFFSPKVETSELEMRNMATFDMIFNPVDDIDPDTGEKSVLYNVDKSIPDRLEDALKDQIFIRNSVMAVYNDIQAKSANAYNGVNKLLSAPFKGSEVGEDTTEVLETDPPVTVPDEGFPDEYYDLAEETPDAPPANLDMNTYPGYGFARLKAFPARNYQYSQVGSLVAYNGTDYLGAKPSKGGVQQKNVQKHVDQYNQLLAVYPNLKFYSYFVSQMQHSPWFNEFFGKYPDTHELMAQYLPEYVEVDRLVFYDFEDYKDVYFKTDHHWSYKGSERGYQDVYNMMADELELSPIKYPIKTWNFTELNGVQYRGSRASNVRNISTYTAYDEFIAYEYDLGERETYVINPDKYTVEIPVTMSLWEKYKVGDINMGKYYDHYINFYGHSYDITGREYADSEYLLVIKNKNNGAKHNLLMVCDSTQRAYRDVLGSHFGTVVTLDYRIMTKVPVDYLIEKYNIDTILCGGLSFAWSGSNSYLFTFSESFGK